MSLHVMKRIMVAIMILSTVALPGYSAAYYTSPWSWSRYTSPYSSYTSPYSSYTSPYRSYTSPYSNYTYAKPAASTTASTYSTAPTTTSTYSGTSGSVESTLLSLINKERTSRGLRALQLDTAASNAAEAKSQEMLSKGYFSHTSPTYGSPAQLLSRYGVSYRSWAENIGKGADAARLHAMWMASSGHRANILNPSFTHVGIGAVSGSTGYTATQLFISR